MDRVYSVVNNKNKKLNLLDNQIFLDKEIKKKAQIS